MPRGTNHKFKLLYLMQIMQEKTDENHGLTMTEILNELSKMDVTAERKSIYTDLMDMERFGIDVDKEQIGRETYYKVISREFDVAEVKLLIDAIQSSKFITEKKSKELIKKIKKFVSENEARQLDRQVYIDYRVKTDNEKIYYNVDGIHSAINENKKIEFKYLEWNTNKKLVERHSGKLYRVSPWALSWDDENYYLVAYDSEEDKIKHYRVDKMSDLAVSDEKREGKDLFKGFDMALYSKATFGMYGGEKKTVKIQLKKDKCGIFIDRFGTDIDFRKVDEDLYETRVDVNVSRQFFGWIFSLGGDVKITGPADVVADMKKAAKELAALYK